MDSSFWQNVTANWFSEVIKVGALFLITLGLTWVNNKYPKWGSHARYALTIFVLLAVLVFAFTGRAVLSHMPSTTPGLTADNAESQIKSWVSSFGYGWQDQVNDLGYFTIRVLMDSNRPLMVVRPKQKPSVIVIQAGFVPTQDDAKELSIMPETKRKELIDTLQIEVARMGLGFAGLGEPLTKFQIQTSLPINADTTSDKLFNALHTMDYAAQIIQATISKQYTEAGLK